MSGLKCTEIDFGWGSTRWGSLQRSPKPIAGLVGPTSNGREGKGRGGGRRGEEEGTTVRIFKFSSE